MLSGDELEQAIKEFKNNMVCGENSIKAELWRYADSRTINILTNVVQDLWVVEEISAERTTALIHTQHKQGNRPNVNNYRATSLLSVIYNYYSQDSNFN